MGETRQRKADSKSNARKEKIVNDKEPHQDGTGETSAENKKMKKVCLIYHKLPSLCQILKEENLSCI